MPTYVYRFIDTNETIEVQQSFSDEALTEALHPVEGVLRPVKKVFTPIGVTFKGGGFYKTDSARSSSSTSSSAGDSASSGTSESSGSSGDAASSAPASTTPSTPAAPVPAATT